MEFELKIMIDKTLDYIRKGTNQDIASNGRFTKIQFLNCMKQLYTESQIYYAFKKYKDNFSTALDNALFECLLNGELSGISKNGPKEWFYRVSIKNPSGTTSHFRYDEVGDNLRFNSIVVPEKADEVIA